MRLDEELDRAIGDGPPHRPVAERIEAGRRAVRRRRALAAGAAALALVAVVGGGWSALTAGSSDRAESRYAGDPTVDPTETATLRTTPALGFSGRDCTLIGDGLDVMHQIDDPFGRAGRGCERAIAFRQDGEELWLLVASTPRELGRPTPDVLGPVPARPDQGFADWVRAHASWDPGEDRR